MVIRFIIDVLGSIETKRPQIEFIDLDLDTEESLATGSRGVIALPIKTNRFAPASFVFRCKVVDLQ